MKLVLDTEGKINYDKISRYTTVQELLDAIDLFLAAHPLPCGQCEESCCKKSWAVEMDNVCVNRLCGGDSGAASHFVQDKLVLKKNYFRQFHQYVLKKKLNCSFITQANLCTIYEQRPVICRLYICSDKSYRYNVLRELIGGTYLKALVTEDKMRNRKFTPRTVNRYRSNPAVFAKDYNILLDDIFSYAAGEGWLDPCDTQELYRAL
jgi:hypothetical protein